MGLSEDDKAKVRLTSENLNRIRYVALLLALFTPLFLLHFFFDSTDEENRMLLTAIMFGFEVMYISYYALVQSIFKKKEYMLIDIVKYSFWAMVVVYGLFVTFVSYIYNGDMSSYYIMLCAITVVALLSFKELVIYMSIQFVVMTAMCIFFSMSFFQWTMILCANLVFFAASRRSRNAYAEVYSMKSKMKKASKSAEEDPLTGLVNRRGLDRNVEEVWHKLDCDSNVGLIIIDIDYFKFYNDRFGHPQGDVCLKNVAAVIKRFAEEAGAVSARIGGEEFVVFMEDTSDREVMVVAERIRAGVEKLKMQQSPLAPGQFVTISLGAAVEKCDGFCSFEELYEEADKALYKAKNSGKNVTSYNGKLYKR